jgi:uncharacterized SAM-binding protein YcdF (DUF218 family)
MSNTADSKKNRRWWLVVFSGVTLIASGGALLVRESRAVFKVAPNQWTQDQKADCAVVLTGGPGRVREGFALLAQRQVKKLIVSGVHPQVTLRELYPMLPFYGSIDEKDVLLERRSTTTYGNVIQSLGLMEALRCRSVLVVTSALHMHRSLRTFRRHAQEGLNFKGRAIEVWPRPGFFDELLEIGKSCFYSLWAY